MLDVEAGHDPFRLLATGRESHEDDLSSELVLGNVLGVGVSRRADDELRDGTTEVTLVVARERLVDGLLQPGAGIAVGCDADLTGLTEVVDDPLCRTVAAVVAVEVLRVKRVVVREVDLETAAVQVVEVELGPTRQADAKVVVRGRVAEVSQLLCPLPGHDVRTTLELQGAHAMGSLGGVEQCGEYVGLGQVGNVDSGLVGHGVCSFLHL